ncbi:MAG TPA: hypothetical protein VFL86_24810 [Burkholderiaceae bacterium]|nr:hypothetical protein [Burkholderiaceae bacterium]
MPRDGTTGPGPLPAALQPWHAWLRWFGPELAVQLGTLVQRLHPLLGRFHGRLQGGEPEPDGLGDLHPRGPYERLLASEWLLADDLPDEFMRRAAMGEHLFLAPRPRGRQAERLIVALFDAGPLQLGAPRLAHLALWILLARRALGAGGELRWGLLQAPGELHEAHGVRHLQQLLRGRCFVPGDASHWAGWSEALAAQPAPGRPMAAEHPLGAWQRYPGAGCTHSAAPVAECWLIGADLLAQAGGWPTHQVRVRRSLGGEALDVSLRDRRAERSLQLPLPAAAAAAALLKGRFEGAALLSPHHQPVPHHHLAQLLSLQRCPLFSVQGHLVAVPLRGQPGVSIFPVQRAQNRPPGVPRRQQWSAGSEPLALCFGGKQVAGLLSDAAHLFFWHVRGLDAQPRPPREQFHAPPGAATWLQSAWLRQGGAQRLCVLDASARLVSWQIAGRGGSAQDQKALGCVAQLVCGLAQYHDGGLVYVQSAGTVLHVCQLHATGAPSRLHLLGHGPAGALVWFAGGAAWARGRGGCAVRMLAAPCETWRVHHPPEPGGGAPGQQTYLAYTLELASGWRAVGLVHHPQAGGYALLVQSPDRMKLYRIHQRSRELVYTAPARMLKCSVCPNTARVALLTAQRQLIVYDTLAQAVRLFVRPAASEDVHAAA